MGDLFSAVFASGKVFPLSVGGGDVAEGDLRAYLLQTGVNPVDVLLFVEDEVCKLLLTVHEDQPVVEVGGTVVRLDDAHARETPVDVLVGDVVFSAQIPAREVKITNKKIKNDFFPDLFIVILFYYKHQTRQDLPAISEKLKRFNGYFFSCLP